MFKILISVNFLILLVACKVEKGIIYGPYKAFICEENNEECEIREVKFRVVVFIKDVEIGKFLDGWDGEGR